MKPEQLFVRPAKGMRAHPLTRWHRMAGIASTLIVIVTVLTGLALNHGDALDLPHRHPHNIVIDKLYHQRGAGLPAGYSTSRGWLTQLGAQVYLDTQLLTERDAPLVGALIFKDSLLLAYRDGLVQYDAAGKVLETYGALDGLAPPLTRLGSHADAVVVETAAGTLRFDLEQGTSSAVPTEAMIAWASAAAAPPALASRLAEVYRGSGVSYERVLLDVHSGRLFGRLGEFVVDAAALCLLSLALSGTYMFFKFKRGNQRPSR